MKTYAIRLKHGDKTYLSNIEATNENEALQRAKEAYFKRLGVTVIVEPSVNGFDDIFDKLGQYFKP